MAADGCRIIGVMADGTLRVFFVYGILFKVFKCER